MRHDDQPARILTPGEAGRILGVSAKRVSQLVDGHELKAIRTATGRRLILADDCARLAAERAARRAEK